MAANAVGTAEAANRQAAFSAELRQGTLDEHRRIEQALGLSRRPGSCADLARLLAVWREIWSEVRVGCGPAGHDEAARLLVLAVRAVQQTAADLRALARLDDACAPANPAAPLPADPHRPIAALLGTQPGVWAVSYVLRGSRVGGTFQVSLIARRLRLPDAAAMDYYGDGTAARSWAAFQRRLDAWGRRAGPSGRDAAAHVALQVFGLVGARLLGALPAPSGDPANDADLTLS